MVGRYDGASEQHCVGDPGIALPRGERLRRFGDSAASERLGSMVNIYASPPPPPLGSLRQHLCLLPSPIRNRRAAACLCITSSVHHLSRPQARNCAFVTTEFEYFSTPPIHPIMNATKVLQQGRQPMIRFLGKRSTPSSMCPAMKLHGVQWLISVLEVDHTPHAHPASPTHELPSSFASYRQKAQQHGPLNTVNSPAIGGHIGGAAGRNLGAH